MSDELRKQFEEWAEESYGGDAKKFFARCSAPHEEEYQHADVQSAWKAAQYFYKLASAAPCSAEQSQIVLRAAADAIEKSFPDASEEWKFTCAAIAKLLRTGWPFPDTRQKRDAA